MNVVHGLIINIMIKSNVKMGLRLSFAVIQSRFTIDYNILSIVKLPSSSTVLYRTVLYHTVLYCTVMYCTVLYCTVLYCNILYHTVDWINTYLL